MILIEIFGAPKISMADLDTLIKNSPNLIIYAAPVMLFFAALEVYISYKQEHGYYEKTEAWGSLWVGIGNVLINFVIKSLLILPFLMVYNLVPWRQYFNWWMLIPCYIIFDFASYWAHRVSHSSRFWWATHIVHHSGEHYNLTVSFRLSWVQNLKLIFFLPVMLFGFHPIIFFIVSQAAVLFQFWVHTEYIRKMPRWVEYIFATPSNHRVHHGSQENYIDKNFGATFIIWDRWLGTYEPERDKVIYGITTNITNKGNPFYINFHEYKDIWNDMKRAPDLRTKLYYLWGSPIGVYKHKIANGLVEKDSSLIVPGEEVLRNKDTLHVQPAALKPDPSEIA